MPRRRQAVTIKHVAADAGVSLQTVSRVINNAASVSEAMKKVVQASIDKLGYVPSIAAQRMSGSRSYLILAVNDRDRTIADWRSRQGADWVDQMLLGGMLKSAEHGYRMIFELVDTHSDHVERELSAAIAALQPDGIILTPPHSDNQQIVSFLAASHIPFVRIGSRSTSAGIPISMNDEGSARMATEYLVARGHHRIGFIAGSLEYGLSARRVEGWQKAMASANLSTEHLLAQGDFSFASGTRAAKKLLNADAPPTAIIASNDQMALATLKIAYERNLDVPRQLSIISFDNTPIVRFAQPALTAIDQPIAETAAKAVELIIAAKNGDEPPAERTIMKTTLVERASVASCLEPTDG